jgi:hypothetical protein
MPHLILLSLNVIYITSVSTKTVDHYQSNIALGDLPASVNILKDTTVAQDFVKGFQALVDDGCDVYR